MGRSPESPFPFAPCPTPVEQAQEALEEEKAIPTPQTRRKSSTWKGFNLKRQLSRVDNKLKKSLKEKRGSIFFTDVSPGHETRDIVDDFQKSSPETDDITVIDNPSVINLTITPEDPSHKSSEDIVEPTQFSLEDEIEVPFVVGSLGSHLDYLNGRKDGFPIRPDNLELIGNDCPPVRPPRQKKKQQEQRDYRLLSVPNIKFLRLDQQSLKDLRDREDTAVMSPQQSFTGNFMRRFSKFQI